MLQSVRAVDCYNRFEDADQTKEELFEQTSTQKVLKKKKSPIILPFTLHLIPLSGTTDDCFSAAFPCKSLLQL